MKRLTTLLKWDFVFQVRYNLLIAGLFLTAMWTGILFFLPRSSLLQFIPMVLLGDVSTMGYLFVGAMVFLEKEQGSINALVVTPVKVWEYIFSKTASLFLYTLCVSVLVVCAAGLLHGTVPNFFYLLLSSFFTAVFFTLLGLFFSTNFKSFSALLLTSGLVFMILYIPFFGYFPIQSLAFLKNVYYLFPTQGMLFLIQGIFFPQTMGKTLYAVIYNGGLIVLLFWACIRRFDAKMIGRRGAHKDG